MRSSESDLRNRSLTDREHYNARLGLRLFAAYCLFYAGFVLISAFRADWMDYEIIAGMNLAIVYGFALIIVAILLSFVYGCFCRLPLAGDAHEAQSEKSQ
jgi:uncharacterized membrane protein (DUF485 family)